jgi:hypothetical protein
MNSKIECVALINPENVKRVVSAGEKSLKDCWAKLIVLQRQDTSKRERFEPLISFQPDLLSTLVNLESFYNEICEMERELVAKKAIAQDIFKDESERIARYKRLLDGIIDIGKSLGDAFAWLFYLNNRALLKKHYEHPFIPRLPTRIGGKGEVEFIRNCQMFGRYFVLSHSITTFLREGDVSLIAPGAHQVAAIGELKSEKKSDMELTTSIYFLGGRKLPKNMLPKISGQPQTGQPSSATWDADFKVRLKKQIGSMKKLFETREPDVMPEKLRMSLAFAKLEKLYGKSSADEWGYVQVGRGLLLIGVRFEESSWAEQVIKGPPNEGDIYKKNMERIPLLAREIVDKHLPDNGLIIGSMFYPAEGRYELGLKMRPLFWWPLSAGVREAIIFKKMVVMTLYNPAFLIKALREAGFDVEFKKGNGLHVTKEYGLGRMHVVGMTYLYELIQTHLFTEETIVTMLQKSVEKIEKARIKQTTYVSLDFDFVFQ